MLLKTNHQDNNQEKRILLIDAIFLYICIVSLLNVFLLSIGKFYPILSISVGIVIAFIILIFQKKKICFKDTRFSWIFLLIIILAIFFRLNPNLYLTGGQDQGSYVSLSKQYEVNHSLYIKDKLRDTLSDQAKVLYDKSGAAALLGIEEFDLDSSIFYMPFYPVFPSWMATFASIFDSDHSIYAISIFSILSIVGIYLFSYEISGKQKSVALLASFLIAINPLHVYFSRIPLTEVVSLCFLSFSLYFFVKFYNDYKYNRHRVFTLVLSLLAATAMFYTRMSGLLFLPIVLLIPILSILFCKDKKLTKYLWVYCIIWIISLGLSYLFYYIFLPDLFNSIVNGRILRVLSSYLIIFVIVGLLIIIFISIRFKKFQKIVKDILLFVYKYFYIFFITIFVGLIFFELYFYIKEIFINNEYTIFSLESLSYFKQLNFFATFLYLSPIGFLLLPISVIYFKKRKDVKIGIIILMVLIFLVYCWGIIRLSPYHYYFIRYQLSELIPLSTILISIFLVDIFKKKIGKILLISTIVFSIIYFGYFSLIQLRTYEGANQETFKELQSIVQKEDLLLVANNDFESSQQIVFPIKYYFGINTFLIYTSTYIDYNEIKELKGRYEDIYILTTDPSFEQNGIKLVKEMNFKHNYFVHCRRDKDKYFVMESHSPDIPFCKYVVIPNRYYYGTYKMYLYFWE